MRNMHRIGREGRELAATERVCLLSKKSMEVFARVNEKKRKLKKNEELFFFLFLKKEVYTGVFKKRWG